MSNFLATLIIHFLINLVWLVLPVLFAAACLTPSSSREGALFVWFGLSFVLALVKALSKGEPDVTLH